MPESALYVFDFDGTLFKSPADTPENRTKFERSTGIPWLVSKEESRQLSQKLGRHVPIRRGWWGRAETLQPPLVPEPAPHDWFIKDVCDELKRCQQEQRNGDARTLIMTGRHVGLEDQVKRILKDGDLACIEKITNKRNETFYRWADSSCSLYCLGDRGFYEPQRNVSVPSETFPWKCWIIQQYIDLFKSIKRVEIWEDRAEHVEKFRELSGALAEEVIVHEVKV